MTVAFDFNREPLTNRFFSTDFPDLVSEITSKTALASVVGRLLGLVSNTSTTSIGTSIAEQITASDYRPLSLPLVRSDFETALSLREVLPSTSWEAWELDDFVLRFKPKEAIKVKMMMRYVGKLPPSQISTDEDWLE